MQKLGPCQQLDLPAIQSRVHAVAVVLDLVQPRYG